MKLRPAQIRRTSLICVVLASFLGGLGLARIGLSPGYLAVFLSFVLCGLSWRRKDILAVLMALLFGVIAGWSRGSIFLASLKKYDDLFGHNVTLVGVADSDAVYGMLTQLSFDMRGIKVVEPNPINLVGKLGVKGFGENMVYKGDSVRVSGKLYQTKGSKQAGISFAEIEVLSRSTSLVESVRRKFEAGMHSALPEPGASFGLGLLIGQRSNLPDSVSAQLSAVGLTHVVAVSGYNLTIIMSAVRQVFKKRSKYQLTVITILLVAIFLLFTGFSASIVRAALVGCLSLAAWYYGRTFRPIVLLLLTAAITAGIYPIYLWSDIGWYLSFLAFFGVMILAPHITRKLLGRRPKLILSLVIETSSAQIMTFPIIMYIFGQFSVIALLANLLVVPLVSAGMLFCLIAGLAGAFIAPVAGWVSWPAKVLLTYMLDIVGILAKLPNANIKQPIDLTQMIVLYASILLIAGVIWRKNRGEYGIIKPLEQPP